MSFSFQGDTVDSEYMSELTEEEQEVNVVKPHLKGFVKIDVKYFMPFFTRRFTKQVSLMFISSVYINVLQLK